MFRRIRQSKRALLAATLLTLASLTSAAQIDQAALQDRVTTAQSTYNLVGLGVAILSPGQAEPIIAVAGERRSGSGAQIEPGDAWHIGSNTKMLTALTYARLVKDGRAKWGATLPDLFPDLSAAMHPDWHSVTIEDLLAHRSGLTANPGPLAMIARALDERTPAVQRAELVQTTLTAPAKAKAGTFTYSNLGYILVGAAIETRLAPQTPDAQAPGFEALFLTLFAGDFAAPEAKVGFGPPKAAIQGHRKGLFTSKLKAVGDTSSADNPAIFGPAGGLHMDLHTHARFLARHFMAGDTDITSKLLTPYPDANAKYALGWGVAEMEGIGTVFSHAGSNTMWLSDVTYAPALQSLVIINTSQFNDDARKAVQDLRRDLLTAIAAGQP